MQKLSSLLFSLILGTSLSSFADENTISLPNQYHYQFSIDSNRQDAYTGADLSMSLIEGYRQIEDKLGSYESSMANMLLIFPRLIATNYVSTFQHEIFGHGARARAFRWKVNSYHINLNGTGSTSYMYPIYYHKQYKVLMGLGGSQATEVLSCKVRGRFTDTGRINPVYGAAYLNSAADQIGYVMLRSYKGKSHDIQNYIDNMNILYGKNYITQSKIKQRTWLSFADPFLYFSAYALGTNEDFEFPMIEIGDVGYLPGFRAVFTPYGLENQMINYIRTSYTPVQIKLSQGKHKTGTALKGELIVDKLYSTDKVKIGVDLAIWKQPQLFAYDVTKASNKKGFMFEVNATLRLSDTSRVYSAIGYKAGGFMIGYPVKASSIFRVGVGFDL